LWLVYGLVFSWTILPSTLSHISATISDHKLFIHLIIAFIIFAAAVYVAIVLLRFTFLKTRLTGEMER
jgi:large-conductance mechanosensitive channel